MIAMNYIKHPEALRFQCEMFSNGYHNSPRIMRLMQCIFDQRPDVPQWFKDMRAKAKSLVKAWKSRMVEMFDMVKKTAKKVDPRQLKLVLFPAAEPKRYWLDATAEEKSKEQNENYRFSPILHSSQHSQNHMKASGNYRNFCQACNHSALFTCSWAYGFNQ